MGGGTESRKETERVLKVTLGTAAAPLRFMVAVEKLCVGWGRRRCDELAVLVPQRGYPWVHVSVGATVAGGSRGIS